MDKPILVLTTVPNEDAAKNIARTLIESHLAACVQISSPVKSVFHWEGTISSETEYQLWIKSFTSHFKDLEAKISTLHPYEVPEILSIPILDGNSAYINWMSGELKK